MIYTPISKFLDWLSAFLNLLFIPFVFILIVVIIISSLGIDESILVTGVIIFLFLCIIIPYYQRNHNKLTKFATDTSYVHFKPSYKDLILGFYGQGAMVVILMIVVFLFFPSLLNQSNNNSIVILSFSIAFIFQLLTFFLVNRSKIKLIETATIPVDQSLIQKLNEKTKDASKIKNFFYADIKPASLFLSAGVTNFSLHSNICLISRYFQLKLSEKELMSVLGHEIGHVVHKDMFQSQFLLDLQAIMRFFMFYVLLLTLKFFFGNQKPGALIGFLTFMLLVITVIIQLLISYTLKLRMYNQEILADEYGASIMGNYNLAYTLKKLPNVMPAPVDDSPLNFLGFRNAILFNRAKQLNETDESVREFSRFSNN